MDRRTQQLSITEPLLSTKVPIPLRALPPPPATSSDMASPRSDGSVLYEKVRLFPFSYQGCIDSAK